MRMTSRRPVPPEEVFDLSVCSTHNFATDSKMVVHNCYGKTCGVCDLDDLKLRRDYIQGAAEEVAVDLSNVKVIDQRTVAQKIRCKVVKSTEHRFVMNDHFHYAIRRAAYRAGMPITKRTVRFSSDAIKFKDWTCGADFLEFGVTRKLSRSELKTLVEAMNEELKGNTEVPTIQITDARLHPASSDPLRADVDLSLFDLEVKMDPISIQNAIDRFRSEDYVKMILREEQRMAGIVREEVNAKDFVDNLWLVRDGHQLKLRMLVRGKASPYDVYAALVQRNSVTDAAEAPAVRVEAFVNTDENQIDFFRPTCVDCEKSIPVNLLDEPYDPDRCPKCKDEHDGVTMGEGAMVPA